MREPNRRKRRRPLRELAKRPLVPNSEGLSSHESLIREDRDAAIGLWKDRTDIQDVSAYLRQLRKGR
jgi:hypothetical protein